MQQLNVKKYSAEYWLWHYITHNEFKGEYKTSKNHFF